MRDGEGGAELVGEGVRRMAAVDAVHAGPVREGVVAGGEEFAEEIGDLGGVRAGQKHAFLVLNLQILRLGLHAVGRCCLRPATGVGRTSRIGSRFAP